MFSDKKLNSLLVLLIPLFLLCAISFVEEPSFAAEWGAWSEWQDAKIDASSTRQVETRQIVDSYNMETWVYTDQSSPNLRGYWPNATGNTLRAHYTETWAKSLIDNPWRVINANTFYDSPDNDNCDGQIHDARAYVVVDGQGHSYVPFFLKGENYKIQYRYRDQIIKDTNISSATVDSKTDPGTNNITYNGKSVENNIIVVLNGRILTNGTDYSISYDKTITTGKVKVTIKGKGEYSGSTSATFTIIPPKIIVKTITVNNNQIIVYWDEVVEGADGYEIQTSLNSDFSDAVTTTVKKRTKTKCTVSRLSKTGTYYVRVRAYSGSGKARCYSNWSPVKNIYVVVREGSSYDLSLAKVNPISDKAYTGKAIKPNPTIVNGTYVLQKGVDYTVKYKNNIKIGTATVIMTGKGKYYNSCKASFRIVPKGTKITKLTSKAKGFKISWKRVKNCTGYQICYSTDPNFSSSKTKTVNRNKKTRISITGLSAKKVYYVKIRTYRKTKRTQYSRWSDFKSVKTKKTFNTPEGKQYRQCIKAGNYVYCGAANKLVRVNIKTNKTKTLSTFKKYYHLSEMCMKENYIYFLERDDTIPGYLIRVGIDGKGKKIIAKNVVAWLIEDNRILFYSEDNSRYCRVWSTNLRGKDKQLEYKKNWRYIDSEWDFVKEVGLPDFTEDTFRSNVKGYKTKRTSTKKKAVFWLVKPSGKSVKIGTCPINWFY